MLKKFKYCAPLLLMVLFNACSPQPLPVSTTSPTQPATQQSTPQATPQVDLTVQATAGPTQEPTLPVTSAPGVCKVIDSLLPVIPTGQQPSIPPIDGKKDWYVGDLNAPVSIVEYSDFQCPYCEQISSGVSDFIKQQGSNISFSYRHFPLTQHDKSLLAAQAAEAAGIQGKFWEMHDFLFQKANWDVWTPMKIDEFPTYLKEKAAPAIKGMDSAKFMTDFSSADMVTKVKAIQTANFTVGSDPKNGLGGTPTFYIFVKGQIYNAPPSVAIFQNIIDLAKLDDQKLKECPPMTVDAKKTYTATLKTEKGDIVVNLFPDKAPAAVNSFIYLANKGYYNGVTFHRVISGIIAQTGDPSNSGMGGPGYLLGTEISADTSFDKAGMIGMNRSDVVDTNNSQFFITLSPLSDLNRRYTIFGEITSGLDVAKKLTPRDVQSDPSPAAGDKITSVSIEVK